MNTPHTYASYKTVQHNYINQLPTDWQLLPNIAIFEERIERGHDNQQLLSVTIGRGIIKQTELAKKDSSTIDKSKYLLVYPNDIVYSMRFRQGASGKSDYTGIVSPACTVLKTRESIQINPAFFHYLFRTEFYKNYVECFSYGIADGQIPLRYQDFKRLQSPVPPINTQNQIANYLNHQNQLIDNFIKNKQQLIELQKEIIYSLVIGNTQNKHPFWQNISPNWKIEKAKWIFEEVNIRNCPTEELLAVTQNKGVLPKSMCEENFVSPTEYEGLKLVEENDFVISLRSFQGGIEHSNYQGIVSPAYTVIRLKPSFSFFNTYYKYLFKSSQFIALLNTAITGIRDGKNVHWIDFRELDLPVPTVANVEKMLFEFKKLEQLTDLFRLQEAKIKEYRSSLITALVTGQRAVPVSFTSSNH